MKQGNLEAIRKCPKADLHNHFVLGGSRRYLHEHTGKDIMQIQKPIRSIDEMHVWGLGVFFHGNIEELVAAFETAHREIAPEIELRLQIGLSRHCDITYYSER